MKATENDVSEHMRELAILDEYEEANISNCLIARMAFRFGKTFGFPIEEQE